MISSEHEQSSRIQSLNTSYTRSLLDLQSGPQVGEPAPGKSRRRVLQASSGIIVQRAAHRAPIFSANISNSSHTKPVPLDSHQSLTSCSLNAPISPEREIHQLSSSTSPSDKEMIEGLSKPRNNVALEGLQSRQQRTRLTVSEMELSHKLRNPPLDPRKSRRHCTDFGLSRTNQVKEPPILAMPNYFQSTPDTTSATSTPPASFAGTESDSSSLHEYMQFDFPQPPEGHPFLRRMRSSPLRCSGDAPAVADLWYRRCSPNTRPPLSKNPLGSDNNIAIRCGDHSLSSDGGDFSQYSRNLQELELEGEALVRSSNFFVNPALNRSPTRASCEYELRNVGASLAATSQATKPSCSARPSGDMDAGNQAGRRAHDCLMKPQASRLHHTRSASSMLPVHSNPKQNTFEKRVRDARSQQFNIDVSNPLRRLKLSHDKSAFHHDSLVEPICYSRSVSSPVASAQLPFSPPLTNARRQKLQHSNLSIPSTSLGLSNTIVRSSVLPQPLALPFHHRSTKSQPIASPDVTKHPALENPKSFIDITPERGPSHSGARKVRVKLLARASSVVEWGRSLARAHDSR